MACTVRFSINIPCKERRWSIQRSLLIVIGRSPKCSNRPLPITYRSGYYGSIARIMGTPLKTANPEIRVLGADSRPGHAFPQILPFLADKPVQCTIAMVKDDWCHRCKISLDDMPCFSRRFSCRHTPHYHHMSTTAAAEVGLWKFAEGTNFANAHAGFDIYDCMNVDRWHQLLNGLLKDYTW